MVKLKKQEDAHSSKQVMLPDIEDIDTSYYEEKVVEFPSSLCALIEKYDAIYGDKEEGDYED